MIYVVTTCKGGTNHPLYLSNSVFIRPQFSSAKIDPFLQLIGMFHQKDE